MNTDKKPIWQSKTFWAAVVGFLFVLGETFKFLPEGLQEEEVVTTIMGVVTLAIIIFRNQATTQTTMSLTSKNRR